MKINLKISLPAKNVLLGNIIILISLTGIFLPGILKAPLAEAEPVQLFYSENPEKLVIIEENSILPITELTSNVSSSKWQMNVVVTAYSSSPWETDGDPFLTAAGTQVRDGIVANNYLSFGTKIRIPELFGDKIFVVEDRMSWMKSNYHIDVWFPSYEEALNFGAKWTYIEVLEE
jgi:3D (Asp-Asp-Asp) domain-containing protein